jgi:hypothetical protein
MIDGNFYYSNTKIEKTKKQIQCENQNELVTQLNNLLIKKTFSLKNLTLNDLIWVNQLYQKTENENHEFKNEKFELLTNIKIFSHDFIKKTIKKLEKEMENDILVVTSMEDDDEENELNNELNQKNYYHQPKKQKLNDEAVYWKMKFQNQKDQYIELAAELHQVKMELNDSKMKIKELHEPSRNIKNVMENLVASAPGLKSSIIKLDNVIDNNNDGPYFLKLGNKIMQFSNDELNKIGSTKCERILYFVTDIAKIDLNESKSDWSEPKLESILEFFKKINWQNDSVKIDNFINQVAGAKKTNFFKLNYKKVKSNKNELKKKNLIENELNKKNLVENELIENDYIESDFIENENELIENNLNKNNLNKNELIENELNEKGNENELRKNDLNTLNESNWINDKVLDSFTKSMNNDDYQSFDSNFLNYTIKNESKLIERMGEKVAIFIPYNYQKKHWLFAVGALSFGTFHFSIFNSLGTLGNDYFRSKMKVFFNDLTLEVEEHNPPNYLNQENNNDCGVYVMCGIETMIKDKIKLDPLSINLTTINVNNFKNNLNLNNIPFRQRVKNTLKKL